MKKGAVVAAKLRSSATTMVVCLSIFLTLFTIISCIGFSNAIMAQDNHQLKRLSELNASLWELVTPPTSSVRLPPIGLEYKVTQPRLPSRIEAVQVTTTPSAAAEDSIIYEFHSVEIPFEEPVITNAATDPTAGQSVKPTSPEESLLKEASNEQLVKVDSDVEEDDSSIVDSPPIPAAGVAAPFKTLAEIKEEVVAKEGGNSNSPTEYEFKSVEIEDTDGGKGSISNYASLDAGATVLDASEGVKSAGNLLVRDKDRYMLAPREGGKKWVVISLSEDIHVLKVAISNFEKFSSRIRDFWVLGSVNYPTDKWMMLGNFTSKDQYGTQVFEIQESHHVRYLKLRVMSTYGSEYYCTISELQVYGRTMTEVISELERTFNSESASTTTLPEDLVIPPVEPPSLPLLEDNSASDEKAQTTPKSYTVSIELDYRITKRLIDRFGNTYSSCPNIYAGNVPPEPLRYWWKNECIDASVGTPAGNTDTLPVEITVDSDSGVELNNSTVSPPAKPSNEGNVPSNSAEVSVNSSESVQPPLVNSGKTNSPASDSVPEASSTNSQNNTTSESPSDKGTSDPDSSSTTTTPSSETNNNSNAAKDEEGGESNSEEVGGTVKSPEQSTVDHSTPPTPPVTDKQVESGSTSTSVPPVVHKAKTIPKSSLLPLQNIFMSITKRLQSIELNQTVFDRYLQEINYQYQTAVAELQATQLELTNQIKALKSTIRDMSSKIDNDMASNALVDIKYTNVLEEARRENFALREELLLMRQIIITLKQGILFAIILSLITVLGFLLRLLLRFLGGHKTGSRSTRSLSIDDGRNYRVDLFEKQPLSLNRSRKFGKISYDDAAIHRDTLYNNLVSSQNGFRTQHVNKLRSKKMIKK